MLGIFLSRKGQRSFVPAVMLVLPTVVACGAEAQYHHDWMGNERTRTGIDDLFQGGSIGMSICETDFRFMGCSGTPSLLLEHCESWKSALCLMINRHHQASSESFNISLLMCVALANFCRPFADNPASRSRRNAVHVCDR